MLSANHIVGEPCGRDTAPCIGLGAALIHRQDADAVMLVTPADHVIEPEREFGRAVHVADQMAQENPESIITFGIAPTFASTGYGYIHRGEQMAQRQGVSVFRVKQFKEKPKQPVAEEFFRSGEYYWNSGIFVWKASTILAELQRLRSALYESVQKIAAAWDTSSRQEVLRLEYPTLDRVSIDKAVMEHARSVLVVQAPYRWDDVGSWLALEPHAAAGRARQHRCGPALGARHEELLDRRRRGQADRHHWRQRSADRPGWRLHAGGSSQGRGNRQGAGRRTAPQKAGTLPVSNPSRLLGVDTGSVRIGLAVSDPDRKIAFPLEVYQRRNREMDSRFFRALIEREEVAGLVVGLPVHLDGREGIKATEARAFGSWLNEQTGLPVVFHDERFTTVQAESALWEAGLSHKRRAAKGQGGGADAATGAPRRRLSSRVAPSGAGRSRDCGRGRAGRLTSRRGPDTIGRMSTILDRIVLYKLEEIAKARSRLPDRVLEQKIEQLEPALDFRAALEQAPDVQVIAEVKKASPPGG